MYDPSGLVSPELVNMKMLFQELYVNKVDWDEELTGETKKRWLGWLSDLKQVKEIQVPRCVYYGETPGKVTCLLHGFADASKRAYCAMIYFVCEVSGAITTTLLTSKTSVSPLKPQTTPRLELMSGKILATLMNTVKNALKEEVDISRTRLWLDSKTALWWIANNGWKQFVRHCVNEILKITKREEWAHCPGEENPADVGSRGERALRLKEGGFIWWSGPDWLTKTEDKWPNSKITETPESNEERKKLNVTVANVRKQAGITQVLDVNRFSNLGQLLRVTAWIKRFLYNLRSKGRGIEPSKGALKRGEIAEAENIWIKASQEELKNNKDYEGLAINLNLEDRGGILTCRGRLENSDLELESQQPIILPRDHKLTKLIIEECHRKVHHTGVRSTLAELRSRYWVPKDRQVVKKVLRECVTCRKEQGKSFGAPCTYSSLTGIQGERSSTLL